MAVFPADREDIEFIFPPIKRKHVWIIPFFQPDPHQRGDRQIPVLKIVMNIRFSISLKEKPVSDGFDLVCIIERSHMFACSARSRSAFC